MTDDDIELLIRRVIGGDREAITDVVNAAADAEDPRAVTLAALLAARTDWMARAETLAVTSRDRQIVAIGTRHLAGDRELVDALGRDHLADHPDSLIVAWIVSGAPGSDIARRPG